MDGFDDLDAPVMRVCDEDVPLPYAANLEKLAIIDVPRLANFDLDVEAFKVEAAKGPKLLREAEPKHAAWAKMAAK